MALSTAGRMDTSTLESGSAFPRFHFPFSSHIVPAFVHLFGPNVDGPPEKNKEKSKQNFLPTKDKDKSWWKNKEEFLEKTLAWEIDGL